MREIRISYMSREDIDLTESIKHCGTNKSKYKNDIIYLFKKYIDSTLHICSSCSMEIMMLFTKYIIYYDRYISMLGDNED